MMNRNYCRRIGRRGALAAMLACACVAAPATAAVLRVDINDRTDTPADTQSGFDVLTLDSGGAGAMIATFGVVTIDVDPFSASVLDDRHRTTPVDSGSITESSLYRDFVFSTNNTVANTRGLNVNLTGLAANAFYTFTVWSYDTASAGTRLSDWSAVGGNGTYLVKDDYNMDGSVALTSNTDRSFAFIAKADATGKVVIQGRNVSTTANQPTVFLNALQVDNVGYAPLARFDVNDDTVSPTQSGFIGLQDSGDGGGPTTFNATASTGVKLTVTNTNDQSRTRLTNGPLSGHPLADMLRDFSFTAATSATPVADALHADITGLTPNTAYKVRIYSYDRDTNDYSGSVWFAGTPTSLANTDPTLVGSHYTLTTRPDSGYIDFTLISDATGAIKLTGRGTTGYGGNNLAFLNGLDVVALPKFTDVLLADVNLTNTGQSGAQMDTKAGYVGLNPVNNVGSASDNGVTVTVTSDRTDSPTRNRSNTGDSLYNDFIFANAQLQLDFAGLHVGSLYQLTLISQDTGGNVGHFTDWFFDSDTSPFNQGMFNFGVNTVSPNAWEFTTYFTATASTMTVWGREGNAGSLVFLNGLELREYIIPAPAALPAGLGLMAIGAARRRHRRADR